MMYLYDQNELNFSRNGKTIQNAFNAKVVHYLNSEYTLAFSILMNDEIAKDLEINKIVFAENQPFRITTIQPSLKEFKVYARHVFFDLLDYQVENVNVNSVTGQTVMNAIFSSNDTNFTYTSDITKRSTMNDSKKNIVEMLARAIERFEGELKRDKFSVALNNSVGKDTNYVVYPNKNISSSVKETDISSVCTRVIVEYGEYEDIKQVIVVSENVDLYPQTKTKRYQNLDLKTEADAIAWGKGKFQGINRIDVPKVSIEIDLSLDRELSNLEIGDTLICKIPTLKLDERIQIIGYEFDPSMNLRTKIFAGFKAKGLSGTINNSVVEAIRPEISDVDDKLQQQINEANEAIQKEYEERIESVNDAIAKAEADAEVMKEALQTEISQAVTDWDTEFEEAKTNIDNSIGNVEKILGDRITANTSEITVAKDKISMVVSNGSTASAVQLTPNALTAIAKDINLKGNVQFDSLVEGDGTSTQILGGKIKTNSISANKLIVGNNDNLIPLVQGESFKSFAWQESDKTWYLRTSTLDSTYQQVALQNGLSTQNLNLNNKSVQFKLNIDFFPNQIPSGTELVFETHFYDKDGNWSNYVEISKTTYSVDWNILEFVSPKFVVLPSQYFVNFVLKVKSSTQKTLSVRNASIRVMNAGELIVDGAIRANHIVSGLADIAEIKSKIIKTNSIIADDVLINQAFITKLTTDDLLTKSLTAKSAWITTANIISIDASVVTSGHLNSKNGFLRFDLEDSTLRLTNDAKISYWNTDSNIDSGTRYGTKSYLPSENPEIYDPLAMGTTKIAGQGSYCNHYETYTGIYQVPTQFGNNSGAIVNLAERFVFCSPRGEMFGQGVELRLNRGAPTSNVGTEIIPRTFGFGVLGKSNMAFREVNAVVITDLYSSTLADDSYQNETLQINALDIVNGATVEQATPIMTLNEESDGKRQLLGINLNKTKLSNDDEMPTLNEEIAILWKAVQELSEQNRLLQEQIDLLK